MAQTPESAPGMIEKLSTMVENLVKVTTTKAPIGLTPKQAVWRLNKGTLYRYTPVKPPEERERTPLLLIFALMNKSTILDLRPGNSFVEYIVNKGDDLYLLDWGAPGPEDSHLDLGDYVLEYIPRAIRKMKQVSGSETFNLLGWCIGAMLSTLYASLRGQQDGLRSLILLTAPLDFTDKEQISLARMTDERYFDVDRLLQAFGNLPAGMIDYGAKMLKPGENFVGGRTPPFVKPDNPHGVESCHHMQHSAQRPRPRQPGAAH